LFSSIFDWAVQFQQEFSTANASNAGLRTVAGVLIFSAGLSLDDVRHEQWRT